MTSQGRKQFEVTGDPTHWDNCYRLLHQFCHNYQMRARSFGVELDYNDLFQEASIAYVMALKTFDPSRNFKFLTYMGRAACNRLGRLVSVEIQRRRHTQELDESGKYWTPTGSSSSTESGLTQTEQLERLGAAEHDSILEDMEAEETRREVYSRLSSSARLVLDTLENPPQEIVEELHACQAKARLSREKGQDARAPHSVTFAFLARHILPLRNLSRVKIYQIRAELIGAGAPANAL